MHIELPVDAPIINPRTGRESRTFIFRGKIDRIENGVIIDWKTAADPDAFVMSRSIGFQAECYAIAAEHAGIHVSQLCYRIIRTPALRPSREDRSAEKATGVPYMQAYEDRCVAWILAQDNGVVEHNAVINPARLDMARRWIWANTQRLLSNRRSGDWLPNCNACHTWGRECEYMPICRANALGIDADWVINERFERGESAHVELPASDRDAVTFSSLSTLALCETKYRLRYEERLRPRHDDNEPLRIGSAAHAALEAYAHGGISAATAAVDEWMTANPCIGTEAADRQAVQRAKALAICRAAACRWSV
jgi:hypothetical protein